MNAPVVEQVEIRDEDWYGREFGNERYVDCTFVDVDLTETRSRGTVFEDCRFDNCKFNVSTHDSTALVGCDFRRTSFFGASFVGCKLTGSLFVECKLRPITVQGGQWSSVLLRRADLSGQALSGLVMVEADLSESDLTDADLSGSDLSRASLRRADLRGTDLRRATLVGADLSGARVEGARLDLAGAVAWAESQGAILDDGSD